MNGFELNKVLWCSLLGWVIAQCIKIVVGIFKERRFDFKWLFSTGGMPSSHAAGVSALSTGVGLEAGFNSLIFAICVIYSFTIMFDAQGVRRAAGRQATLLNRIMQDFYDRGQIKGERLIELLGHSPFEVLVGAILGVFVTLVFYFRI